MLDAVLQRDQARQRQLAASGGGSSAGGEGGSGAGGGGGSAGGAGGSALGTDDDINDGGSDSNGGSSGGSGNGIRGKALRDVLCAALRVGHQEALTHFLQQAEALRERDRGAVWAPAYANHVLRQAAGAGDEHVAGVMLRVGATACHDQHEAPRWSVGSPMLLRAATGGHRGMLRLLAAQPSGYRRQHILAAASKLRLHGLALMLAELGVPAYAPDAAAGAAEGAEDDEDAEDAEKAEDARLQQLRDQLSGCCPFFYLLETCACITQHGAVSSAAATAGGAMHCRVAMMAANAAGAACLCVHVRAVVLPPPRPNITL